MSHRDTEIFRCNLVDGLIYKLLSPEDRGLTRLLSPMSRTHIQADQLGEAIYKGMKKRVHKGVVTQSINVG